MAAPPPSGDNSSGIPRLIDRSVVQSGFDVSVMQKIHNAALFPGGRRNLTCHHHIGEDDFFQLSECIPVKGRSIDERFHK